MIKNKVFLERGSSLPSGLIEHAWILKGEPRIRDDKAVQLLNDRHPLAHISRAISSSKESRFDGLEALPTSNEIFERGLLWKGHAVNGHSVRPELQPRH